MGESRYEQIRLGKNIRANLIELKQEIREEAKKRRLAYETGGDYSVFFGLLKNEDPKVRKNAALILGEMECEDAAEPLFEAYQKEETLFVRSAYLKALEAYDCGNMVPELKLCWKTGCQRSTAGGRKAQKRRGGSPAEAALKAGKAEKTPLYRI